jgi:hypothetical protein
VCHEKGLTGIYIFGHARAAVNRYRAAAEVFGELGEAEIVLDAPDIIGKQIDPGTIVSKAAA